MKLLGRLLFIYMGSFSLFACAGDHNSNPNVPEAQSRQVSGLVPRHRIEDPNTVEFRESELYLSNITHIRLYVNGEYIQLISCSLDNFADELIRVFNERKQQAIREKKHLWIDVEHHSCFASKEVQREIVRLEKVAF